MMFFSERTHIVMVWRLNPYQCSGCWYVSFYFSKFALIQKKKFQIVKIWQIVAMKYKNEFKFTICAVV